MAEGDTQRQTPLLAVIALLTLAVAGALDYAIFRQRLQFNGLVDTGQGSYLLLTVPSVGALVVAIFLIAVSWLALIRPMPPRQAGLLLLLLGVPATFAPVLLALGLITRLTLQVMSVTGPHFLLAGAILAILGLVLVVQPDTNS